MTISRALWVPCLAATLWGVPAQSAAPALEEGALAAAAVTLLQSGQEAARVVVLPVDDADKPRAAVLERALVRALRERNREEIVTPARVRAVLGQAAESALRGDDPAALAALTADHAVFSVVSDGGAGPVLSMRLVLVQSGAVLATAQTPVVMLGEQPQPKTSAGSFERLVDDLAHGIESQGVDVRTHRVAVAPLSAESEAASQNRLDRFVQAELLRGLRARGFLVVERAALQKVLDQQALGQALGEENAPQVGQLLGAQTIVVGAVGDAGDRFAVRARAVDVATGKVVGVSDVGVPRDDVVVLADVETRTPLEAAFRSAVAPGWGQAYNLQPGKAVVFAVAGYGAAATTVGLGVSSLVAWQSYLSVKREQGETVERTQQRAAEARQLTNGLLIGTAVASAVTLGVWSVGIFDAIIASPVAE